jgi:hypothetical protein
MAPAMSATVVPGVNPAKAPGIFMFQPWSLGGDVYLIVLYIDSQ